MSLATRCPACGTVFRVVQDQLKVSGGWVRCGQCHEVFNGLQTLFELPAEPAPAPMPPRPAPLPSSAPAAGLFVTRPAPTGAVAPPPAPEPEATLDFGDEALVETPANTPLIDAAADETPTLPPPLPFAYRPYGPDVEESEADTVLPASDEALPDAGDEWPTDPDLEAEADIPAAEVTTTDDAALIALFAAIDQDASTHAAEAVIAPVGLNETAADATTAPAVGKPEPAPPEALPALVDNASAAAAEPAPHRRSKRQRKPAFMREAERAARWRSPGVRAVLGSASALLGLMLALQVVYHLRDDLAARWPASRSTLATWCQLANCQLRAPRALASITLDSSALSRTTRPQVLRFEAELRNSAAHAVMAPALDVSFADNLGHPLVRKVLLPEQLGAPPDGLTPNQTWHVEVPLQVGELPIAGFTAEVFYP